VNAGMVILARESRQMTQTALAQKAGVAQGTISKVENGQLVPARAFIEQLAWALDYHPSLFYQAPLAIKNLPVPFYRKYRVPLKVNRATRASMNFRRLELEKLLRSVEIPEMKVPVLELEDYDGDLEKITKELRTQWHVRPGPIENLTLLLESMGVVIMPFDFGSNRVSGMSMFEADDGLPPLILMNPSIPGDRWRHTLAHELGHVVLHHHLALAPMSATRNIEVEADRFAAALLMPAADIRGHFTRVSLDRLMQLKPLWKTSLRSLVMRAFHLERISEWQYARLFRQINARYGGTSEPIELPREEPRIVAEAARTHTGALGYTEENMLELLGLCPEEYRRFYAPRAEAGARHLRPVQ
jgi:Zn-dependent peptidase ImmA (M78 family)/DNA-binding XRE family transcriptional regulator